MKNSSNNPKQDQSLDGNCEAEVRVLKNLLKKISVHAEELEEELGSANQKINQLRSSLYQRQMALDDLYSSRSWKLTLPVRIFSTLVKSIFYFLSPFHSSPGRRDKPTRGSKSQGNNIPGSDQAGNGNKKLSQRSRSKVLSPLETETCNQLTELIKKKKNRNEDCY